MSTASTVLMRDHLGPHSHGAALSQRQREQQQQPILGRSIQQIPRTFSGGSNSSRSAGDYQRERTRTFVQASRDQLDADRSSSQSMISLPESSPFPQTSPQTTLETTSNRLDVQGPALNRVSSYRSRRSSVVTARTEFSTSSAINRGYSARIDVKGKVKPLSSTPSRNSCQTFAFLDQPESQDKTYRPGDEIKGAVHLAFRDPERGVVTGIKARVRGDLETSVFGVGDASYYSIDNEHGIAHRQLLFFAEQKTLCKKAQIDSGEFRLEQSGLVDHGRTNNLAVPFSFVLPVKIQATPLDLLDNKMKASYKQGKKYVDLPPSVDLETRYAPPKPMHLLDQVWEKVNGHKLRPMARIKYEIDIIVSRRRMGSDLLPPKRGERIILSFNVEPYPPRTAAIPVPNMDHIRIHRTLSGQTHRTSRTTSTEAEAAEAAEAEEDSWTQNLGGYRQPEEVFGELPREQLVVTRSRSQTRIERVSSAAMLPRFRRSSTINVKEGLDGCMKGWLTHTVETELGGGRGSIEAVLSVPATAALYMETKIPFSLELRMPKHVAKGAEPKVELNLVRSVMTYSRLGTLVIEKETPGSLEGFRGPESWSERIRILDLTRQPDNQLPPFYEQAQDRQMWGGNFVINRHERMLRAGSAPSYKQRRPLLPELCHVIPSFAFKALRIEYRLHVRITFPVNQESASSQVPPVLILETPPVLVAASPAAAERVTESQNEFDAPSCSSMESLASAHSPVYAHTEFGGAGASTMILVSGGPTPLARTPARTSLELVTDPSELTTQAPNVAIIPPPPAFDGGPSLEPIPDEADVDEIEEINEQVALGLISPERLATAQVLVPRRSNLLPSYCDSIGPFG